MLFTSLKLFFRAVTSQVNAMFVKMNIWMTKKEICSYTPRWQDHPPAQRKHRETGHLSSAACFCYTANIPESRTFPLADWSVSFCKGSQALGISEVWGTTKSASYFDQLINLKLFGVTGITLQGHSGSWECCKRSASERFPNVFRIFQVVSIIIFLIPT